MNIFDPLISGSLSVSGSGEISGDLRVLGNISGTISNATSASHAAEYLLTSSFGSFTSSYTTGSFTGSFGGDGSNLTNIPASGVTGLNLTRIADGSVTASVSNANGLRVNSNTEITGALTITGSITLNGVPVGTGKLDEVVFNSYSSSNNTTNSLQNGRLDSLEGSTSSLNTFTSSATGRLNTIETTTGSLNTFTSSTNDKLTSLESTTSSLNTFTSSANGRLNSLETASGSIITDLNSYTSSNNTIIGTIQTTTSSLNSFTSSANGRLNSLESASGSIRTDFNTYTSSNNTTNNTQDNRLNSIESTTSSLNSYTSSNNTKLEIIETSTGSLNTFTSSASTRLGSLETESGSVRIAFNSYTSSNDSTNSTQNGRLSALETSSGSLNNFTTSINSKIGLIETSTSSLNGFTSSINTTIKNRLDADNVISGSIQVNITGTSGFTAFSSSIATIDSSQDVRLNSIEGRTGSYATTGSNIFQGNQIITGSLFVSQDLIIGGSSSINFVSQSTLNIGTNLITVNAQNPGVRFGGLAVIDSGSNPQVSGSILFDSINNQWLFVHQNQGTLTSSVILMGPETYNNIGNETYVTANRLVKSTGIEHLTDSNISDNGTTVTILSNAVVNGTFSATGTTLMSGSIQVNHNATTNYVANQHVDHSTVSISTGVGSGLTGGGDITTTRNLSIATGGVTNTMLAGSIANDKLVNSSLTVGSTTISLGGSSTTLAGLTSVTSTAFTGSLQGSISGNAATVTTNANLTGVVTSTGNATTIANGNITNAMLGGSISNDKLVNSSFHIGTTSISLGRGSAAQTLNGVSIDGNSATATTASNVSGIIAIANGGTGASDAATARTNLGLAIGTNVLAQRTFGTAANNNTGDFATAAQGTTADAALSRAGGTMTGNIGWTQTDRGLTWDFNTDGAYIKFFNTGNGDTDSRLEYGTYDDTNEYHRFMISSVERFTIKSDGARVSGNLVYHTGNIPTWNQNTSGNAANVTGIVAIANGGTGATDAATARTNLGLAIGTNVLAQRTFGTAANNNTGDFYSSSNPSGFISSSATSLSLTGNLTVSSGNANGGGIILADDGDIVDLNDAFCSMRFSSGVRIFSANRGGTPVITLGSNGVVTATTFSGALSGNASTATTAGALSSMNISQFTNNSGYITNSTNGSVRFDPYTSAGTVGTPVFQDAILLGPLANQCKIQFGNEFQNTHGSYIRFQVNSNINQNTPTTALTLFPSGFAVFNGNVLPSSNGTLNLGSSSARWNTVFTSDLSMSNGIGDYTIVEGEEDLFIYNNKTSKVFKFLLQEVDPSIVPPKKV